MKSTKTDEISTIPVHPYVESILQKYGSYMPPKPSNQKMNDYIKVVKMKAEIDDIIETRNVQLSVSFLFILSS